MATDYNQLLANPELAGFERQRKMAEMLVQRGQKTPQGQMIGNIYVGASPWEFLGNMAQQYVGQEQLKDIDQQELTMAKALRQQDLNDLQTNMQLYQGVPEKSLEMAGPYGQGVGLEGANVPMPTLYIPEQAPNRQLAMANLLASLGPKSSAMGADLYKQMFAQPEWKAEKRYENGMEVNGWVNVKSPNPSATFIKSSQRPDLDLAKAVDEGYINAPVNVNPPTNISGGQSNFGNSVNKVLSLEGGYVAKDGLSGAPANFGINQKANPDIDVKNLTVDQAKSIYKTRYWDTIGADNLPPKTAEIAFDASVNQGPEYAKQLIQKTGGDPARMLAQRAQDYQAIVKANPEQAKFLPSWMKRLEVLSKDGQPTGDNKFMPENLPQYVNDPSLTPKQNREGAAAVSKDNQNAIKNAKNSFGTLKTAADILNTGAPSSGRAENIITGTKEFFGGGGEASKADAQLGILGTKLTMQVPRFEGPQSDRDTALYTAAAGDVGNPNKPIATRLAAVQQMVELNKKYYPNGDWDSIDVSGPVVKSQTFLSGEQKINPIQFREGLNAADKEAFDWSRKNPTDPRSMQIKKTLGIN